MSNNITSPLVKWFQRLIDFCLCIDRSNHDQAQGMFPETPVRSDDKTPLVDNIFNSIAEMESISAVYKDICAITGNDASGTTTNALSTASSAQSLAVNKKNGKVILNDKNSNANLKERNESRTTNGLITGKDLLATTAQNGVRQISSSKSPLQPVILNGKIGASNSTIHDSAKVNESTLKNGLKGEKYLPLASAQNGVSKLRSSSNSSSHLVVLNEESNCVNGKKISNITNGGKSGSRTEKLAVNENCAQMASGQNHVNKVCRYSLKPLDCKIGNLKNTNERHGQISSNKEKVGSFIEVRAASYIDDIIQNRVSNDGKEKMTKSNDKSKTKSNPNDKNLTAIQQNSIENEFKCLSASNKIGGIPNQSEQIEQILRCFEKSRAIKDDMKVENKLSLDNNKLRLRRLGLNYARSVSLQSPETDQLPIDSVSSQQNVDKVENKEAPNNPTTSSTCGKHSAKRLSLPNIFSGCTYVTAKESENIKLPSPSLKTLKVPIKSYRVMSFPDLSCGGTVVFSELSKHISLPNIYEKDPIVYNVPCTNLNFPPILPSDDLKVERERVTGGGLIKEDDSKKICLPDLISRDRSLEDSRASLGYKSMSGGGLVNTSDTDHIFYSDIHSSTVACEQLSSLREFMNTENSSAGDVPRPMSETYISDFLNRKQRDIDDSRRNSSTN